MRLVVDFDVSRSFVLQGNPETPAGVRGVIFTPTIRATGYDVAASISGTVTTSLTGVSVEGLTVRADPTNGGTVPGYQTMSATGITASDGSYTLFFLVPGDYDVTVELSPGLGTDPAMRQITLDHAENETGVDFDVIDVTGSIAGAVSTALTGVSVEGVNVTATPTTGGAGPLTTTTAADGTYLFDDVIAGTYLVTIEVGTDQLSDPSERSVDVAESTDVTGVDVAIVEDLTGRIAGTGTTALAGQSVEGLTVSATDGTNTFTTTTGADGDYLIDSLDAASYTVTVTVGTGLATNPASIAVVVAAVVNEVSHDFEVVAAS
jgi:hypothetical protein